MSCGYLLIFPIRVRVRERRVRVRSLYSRARTQHKSSGPAYSAAQDLPTHSIGVSTTHPTANGWMDGWMDGWTGRVDGVASNDIMERGSYFPALSVESREDYVELVAIQVQQAFEMETFRV